MIRIYYNINYYIFIILLFIYYNLLLLLFIIYLLFYILRIRIIRIYQFRTVNICLQNQPTRLVLH